MNKVTIQIHIKSIDGSTTWNKEVKNKKKNQSQQNRKQKYQTPACDPQNNHTKLKGKYQRSEGSSIFLKSTWLKNFNIARARQ